MEEVLLDLHQLDEGGVRLADRDGDILLRAVPGLLTDWHIDGNIATMVFGAGLLHALITAPQGISGQFVSLGRTLGAKLAGLMPRAMERKL